MKIEESDIKVIDFILDLCLSKEVSLQDLLENNIIDSQQGEFPEINLWYNPRDEFVRYLQILEKYNLCKIVRYIGAETAVKNTNTSITLIRGGFKPIFEKIQIDEEKEQIEFEKSKIDLKLNKWLLKTKWLPHFITFISLLFAVYVYFDSKNDSKKLEERIEKLESKILIPKNESKK